MHPTELRGSLRANEARAMRGRRRMDYATSTPNATADAMVAALKRPAKFKPVESDGAIRAARMLAEIL
jgi:hypothetical protein